MCLPIQVSETKALSLKIIFICIGMDICFKEYVVEKHLVKRNMDAFIHLLSYLYLVSTNDLLIKTTVGSLKQQKMLIPKPKTHKISKHYVVVTTSSSLP